VGDAIFERSYAVSLRVTSVRAAAVVALYRLGKDARRDLEQEALLELWRKFPLFDSRRACWQTFAERVVANRMISVVRLHRSERRGRGRDEPLDELHRTLRAPAECLDLRVDVRRVLASVSHFDRAVARSLIDYSATETSHRLGVSRATLYRAVRRLRTVFMTAGLAPGSAPA